MTTQEMIFRLKHTLCKESFDRIITINECKVLSVREMHFYTITKQVFMLCTPENSLKRIIYDENLGLFISYTDCENEKDREKIMDQDPRNLTEFFHTGKQKLIENTLKYFNNIITSIKNLE